jgi:tRNA (pseudouridine54-N1)-methyltransferase
MRRWVIIGQRASASPDFSLIDLAGTSGRLDVLLRCVRSAFLVSHGLRRDTIVYLVLLGGKEAPRTLRINGEFVRFVRPDERSLATMVQKALATPTDGEEGFVPVRSGLAIAKGGIEVVQGELPPGRRFFLDPGGVDIRNAPIDLSDPIFFIGDHLGMSDEMRAAIRSPGLVPVSVGPIEVHAEDAISIASNELDRREACTRRISYDRPAIQRAILPEKT